MNDSIYVCPFCYAQGHRKLRDLALEVSPDNDHKKTFCPRGHGAFLREKLFDEEWYQAALNGIIKMPNVRIQGQAEICSNQF